MSRPDDLPKLIKLEDYQPPAFTIKTTRLSFNLEPDSTSVEAILEVVPNTIQPDPQAHHPLTLDGEARLVSLSLNDQRLTDDDYTQTDHGLTLHAVPAAPFRLTIKTELSPATNTELEGLYLSSGNFCTQCEPQGFRRITYYLDRPDVMARFTTTIEADQALYPALLSNGNPVDRGVIETEAGNRHWVTWEDPFAKPAYLFALVAGKLDKISDTFTTRSGRTVALEIYVQAHNLDQCEHAMASLKRAMTWDEQRFNFEYDLDIYMIVAVDDFNMGAMENKGLNIFNSKFVLARPDTATDHDYEHIEAVIGHEYFHNWTGNRITCRDWFQLSLKEGLTVFRDQEFTSDLHSRPVKRIDDVRLLKTVQFPEDAGPMAHPIRPESYIEINNFYTVTVYEKGGEVIRMLHTLLGEAGFQRGMQLYVQRHDGHAVTTEDFIAAMRDANPELRQTVDLNAFEHWYHQAGTPRIKVAEHYDAAAKQYTLTLSQSTPDTPDHTAEQGPKAPVLMPVNFGLLDPQGQAIPLHCSEGAHQTQSATETQLLFKQAQQQFVFDQVDEWPVPSLFRGFSAPVNIEHAYSDGNLLLLWRHDQDPFNRWNAGQQYAERLILETAADWRAQGHLEAPATDHAPISLPEAYLHSFQQLLEDAANDNLDLMWAAEALRLPSERYLMERTEPVDIDALHVVRQSLIQQLATASFDLLLQNYQQLQDDAPYAFNAADVARRSLKNLCLHYLMQTDRSDVLELTLNQYRHATNMTDIMAALNELTHVESALRNDVLDEFYQQWQNDALVVDKWLTLQATSDREDTLDRVIKLHEHPAYSINVPNKVRALVGAFCGANPYRFHVISGAGYELLADTVLTLDTINPQVAARMVSFFNPWRRFDTDRQRLMQQQLQRISRAKLSDNVYEIVSRALNTPSH